MSDEDVIRAHYGKALRLWPTNQDRVRVPVTPSGPPTYAPEGAVEPLKIDAAEYEMQRGYFNHAPVYRIVGRYKGAEVELDMRPRRASAPRG